MGFRSSWMRHSTHGHTRWRYSDSENRRAPSLDTGRLVQRGLPNCQCILPTGSCTTYHQITLTRHKHPVHPLAPTGMLCQHSADRPTWTHPALSTNVVRVNSARPPMSLLCGIGILPGTRSRFLLFNVVTGRLPAGSFHM